MFRLWQLFNSIFYNPYVYQAAEFNYLFHKCLRAPTLFKALTGIARGRKSNKTKSLLSQNSLSRLLMFYEISKELNYPGKFQLSSLCPAYYFLISSSSENPRNWYFPGKRVYLWDGSRGQGLPLPGPCPLDLAHYCHLRGTLSFLEGINFLRFPKGSSRPQLLNHHKVYEHSEFVRIRELKLTDPHPLSKASLKGAKWIGHCLRGM